MAFIFIGKNRIQYLSEKNCYNMGFNKKYFDNLLANMV
jgi:hypothetical protein